MNAEWQKPVRTIGLLIIMGALGGCSLFGMEGTPEQMAKARAVHAFDENLAPRSQRYPAARAYYKPRVYGLNPYFGR
ncbi:MAG: hypothetical protein ACR2QF_01950 [Geminicoccaceae bacterium]